MWKWAPRSRGPTMRAPKLSDRSDLGMSNICQRGSFRTSDRGASMAFSPTECRHCSPLPLCAIGAVLRARCPLIEWRSDASSPPKSTATHSKSICEVRKSSKTRRRCWRLRSATTYTAVAVEVLMQHGGLGQQREWREGHNSQCLLHEPAIIRGTR